MEFTIGSLFAGVGGICLGFQQAKYKNNSYKLVWANEIDEYACATYRNNFNHSLFQGDIEKILHPTRIDNKIVEIRNNIKIEKDTFKSQELEKKLNDLLNKRELEFEQYLIDKKIPKWIFEEQKEKEFEKYVILRQEILKNKIDVLNGGFPCQTFSIAGEQKGFKDPRGNLFLSIIDLIELLGKVHTIKDENGNIIENGKPRILLLENVKNLQSHDEGRTYRIIKDRLENCGYTIFEKVLNTMDYTDLPQNRERIYIIGFRDKQDAQKFNFFSEDNLKQYKVKKTPEDRVKDIKNIIDYSLTQSVSGKYYYTKEKYPNYFVSESEFDNTQRKERINIEEQVDEMYQFYQIRRGMYIRKNKSNVCPTLTANMGTGGHNVPLIKVADGIRKITPKEVYKLQGFPVGNGYEFPTQYAGKPYSDSHLYKQAGNAVSVPMIKMLAEAILRVIGE